LSLAAITTHDLKGDTFMSDILIQFLFGATAVTTALVAGVFLAFSDFIMRSLTAARPSSGLEAMQVINRKVLRSAFVAGLLLLAPVMTGLAAYAWLAIEDPSRDWFVAGAVIYMVGTFAVTLLGNVPMNNHLEALPTDSTEARDYWRVYARRWTRLNHLRTAASAMAAVCLLVGTVVHA